MNLIKNSLICLGVVLSVCPTFYLSFHISDTSIAKVNARKTQDASLPGRACLIEYWSYRDFTIVKHPNWNCYAIEMCEYIFPPIWKWKLVHNSPHPFPSKVFWSLTCCTNIIQFLLRYNSKLLSQSVYSVYNDLFLICPSFWLNKLMYTFFWFFLPFWGLDSL